MLDHDPITIQEFLGTFDRGDEDSVPPGFFRDSRNVRFITGGVESREGTSLDVTIASVKRIAVYKRIGEAQRLLLLDATGQLFDSTSLGAPILSIAAMSDFSVEVMFNRAYITPHNGITGLPGEKVYVYEGSGVARAAAGTPPSGTAINVFNSATSGNVEVGVHVFAVCFETSSGFLTKPGCHSAFVADGEKKADITTIPLGGSAVVARQIVCTREIVDYNGDVNNQEYFLVPGGRIGNNVDTTVSVSFFDSELISSAEHLMDELSEIPAGVGLMNYRGHLCVWGENANSSIVRVSKAGEPESHDSVEGYLTVNPGDNGGGILNCAEYRTQLLMLKDERGYVTQDNGQNAAFWEVPTAIESSAGSSCHGIAQVRDFGDNLQDRLFIASRPGLQIFNGTFSEAVISYPVDAIWSRITKAYFHTIELVIDPVESLLYCAIPLDGATSPTHLLIGDFQDGLTKFRWTLWTFPRNPTSIVVDVNNATKTSIFKFGALNGNVYKLDEAATDDFGTAISAYIQFGHLPFDDDERVWHFIGIRLRIKGSGALDIFLYGEDSARTASPASLVLAAAPGRGLFRGFDFTNEKCSVRLGVDGAGESFTLTKFILYAKVEWEERPE